jgi:hypothetical protein
MTLTARFQLLGAALFLGSLLVGLPAFGLGWYEPHTGNKGETQLWNLPRWLGGMAVLGFVTLVVSTIVGDLRDWYLRRW